jgi:hypothetical protein
MNMVRVYPLSDGDIIEFYGKTLEFENKLFYEVVFKGFDKNMQSVWERTGKSYTPEELNKIKE